MEEYELENGPLLGNEKVGEWLRNVEPAAAKRVANTTFMRVLTGETSYGHVVARCQLRSAWQVLQRMKNKSFLELMVQIMHDMDFMHFMTVYVTQVYTV
jgi:hypothetical protein